MMNHTDDGITFLPCTFPFHVIDLFRSHFYPILVFIKITASINFIKKNLPARK
jgi:hypothetical protein